MGLTGEQWGLVAEANQALHRITKELEAVKDLYYRAAAAALEEDKPDDLPTV